MANVQLPSINTTPSDIDNAGMRELRNVVKSLLNSTIQLNEELTFLLNNLDTRNVNELNAEVIVANSITADKIQAKAITAEKIDVEELSAISADVGKVTSGEIYGNYIATKENAYPRAEMSNTEDLFGAYKDANNGIAIEADYAGSPRLKFDSGGQLKGSLNTLLGGLTIDGIGTLWINSTGSIMLSPSTAVIVEWDKFKDSDGRNLGDTLLNYATLGAQTELSPSFNGGILPGTRLMTADGGTVTWTGIPAHTHTQT